MVRHDHTCRYYTAVAEGLENSWLRSVGKACLLAGTQCSLMLRFIGPGSGRNLTQYVKSAALLSISCRKRV